MTDPKLHEQLELSQRPPSVSKPFVVLTTPGKKLISKSLVRTLRIHVGHKTHPLVSGLAV